MGRGSQTHHSVSDSPCGLSPSKFLPASWATTSFCCGSSASQVPAVDLATLSPLSLATSSLCLHPDRPRLCQCREVSASFQLKIVELFYALSPQVLREVRGSAGTCRVCYGQLVQPEGAACAVPLVKLLTALLHCFASVALLYHWFPPTIRWSLSVLFGVGADKQSLVCHQWSPGDVSCQILGSPQDSCAFALSLICRSQQVVPQVQ